MGHEMPLHHLLEPVVKVVQVEVEREEERQVQVVQMLQPQVNKTLEVVEVVLVRQDKLAARLRW